MSYALIPKAGTAFGSTPETEFGGVQVNLSPGPTTAGGFNSAVEL